MTYILAVSLTESSDVYSLLPRAYTNVINHTACGAPLCACTYRYERRRDPQNLTEQKVSLDPHLTGGKKSV